MWDASRREIKQIILMTDFGSGISDQTNIWDAVMQLVRWLVQLSNPYPITSLRIFLLDKINLIQ